MTLCNLDEFIVSSIQVHLCEWGCNETVFIKGKKLEVGVSDVDLIINLPDDVMDKLWEFSDYHDESMSDVIHGMMDNTLEFLELNWTGHFNKEDELLSDNEKLEELKDTHNNKDGK